VFKHTEATAVLEGLKVATPMGEFGAAKTMVEVGLNGVVETGQFREKFAFEGITAPPGVIPPWAEGFTPSSLSIDFSVSDYNLAAPAGIMLQNLDLAKNPPIPKELDQQLLQALLPKGTVTLSLGPSSIVSKIAEIGAEGSMVAGPTAPPSGSATVTAKGFDQAIEALKAVPPEMGLAQLVTMMIAAKGMSKPGDSGSLMWKIEGSPAGVTINGIDPTKM
jgi:hypothetical protein